jgi:hypothetical protein
MKYLKNFNNYKIFYFKWNRFYYFVNNRPLKACSETFRVQREATTWEHEGIQVTSQMTPWRHDKRNDNDTKKGKRSNRRAFSKRESNVYKPEFTV